MVTLRRTQVRTLPKVARQLEALDEGDRDLILDVLRVVRSDPHGPHIKRHEGGVRSVRASRYQVFFAVDENASHECRIVLALRIDCRRPRSSVELPPLSFTVRKLAEVLWSLMLPLLGLLPFL